MSPFALLSSTLTNGLDSIAHPSQFSPQTVQSIMDFADQIHALASRITKQLEHLSTEEATKNALVLPFINALGYDVFDPTEVIPEFTADVGIKKGEKVDYAIMLNGSVIMLFECKHSGADLNEVQFSQLFRYFAVTDARIGVLTNGLQYRFYSDLEEPNKMDQRPFLEFDMKEIQEPLLAELKKLTKAAFNIDQLLSTAHELKYTKALKVYLNDQWHAPSEDFVKFLTKKVYEGMVTQSVKEEFTEIVRRALHQFVNDRVSGRLKSALREEEGAVIDEAPALGSELVSEGSIQTTEEEIEAYHIVRAIMRDIVDVKRIAMRDVKSYCGILLDDNNRQPICRFHFNGSQNYIGLFDEQKKENRLPIADLDEIYKHADQLRAMVEYYN